MRQAPAIYNSGSTITSSGTAQLFALPYSGSPSSRNSARIVRCVSPTSCYVKFGRGLPISTTITVTSSGSGYTSVPTVTIADPAMSGTTATAVAHMQVTAVSSIGSGGTGYQVGDVLSHSATGTAATFTVSTVASGVITGISVTSGGDLTSITANPVSMTGGHGHGATLNLARNVKSVVVTNRGDNYATAPAVTIAGNATATAALGGTLFAATASDILITNQQDYFDVNGASYFSVIQDPAATAGLLNIVPVE